MAPGPAPISIFLFNCSNNTGQIIGDWCEYAEILSFCLGGQMKKKKWRVEACILVRLIFVIQN